MEIPEKFTKSEENAITLFYHFVKFKGYKIDGDLLDEFYYTLSIERQNKELMREMEDLEIKN